MGYAGEFVAVVCRIVQAIRVDGPMIRIRKQGKVNFPSSIGRQLDSKLLAHLGRINADGEQTDVFVFLEKRA